MEQRIDGKRDDSFTLDGKVDIYFKLMNQNFKNDFNRFKNWEARKSYHIEDSRKLHFSWYITRVEVERCGRKEERWLMFRDYGCRGSYGFAALDTTDGNYLNIMEIDFYNGYEVSTNTVLGYEMTTLNLCEDYALLLRSIKDNKIYAY